MRDTSVLPMLLYTNFIHFNICSCFKLELINKQYLFETATNDDFLSACHLLWWSTLEDWSCQSRLQPACWPCSLTMTALRPLLVASAEPPLCRRFQRQKKTWQRSHERGHGGCHVSPQQGCKRSAPSLAFIASNDWFTVNRPKSVISWINPKSLRAANKEIQFL